MSLVVIVDEHDQVIGTLERARSHRTGIPHRTVAVYVEDGHGKILVQVRNSGRLDHSASGHVDPGETYEQAAIRELAEELSITGVPLFRIGHVLSKERIPEKRERRAHECEIFLCTGTPGALDPKEVREVYWADPKAILQDMHAHPTDMRFSGSFRAALPLFLQYRELHP